MYTVNILKTKLIICDVLTVGSLYYSLIMAEWSISLQICLKFWLVYGTSIAEISVDLWLVDTPTIKYTTIDRKISWATLNSVNILEIINLFENTNRRKCSRKKDGNYYNLTFLYFTKRYHRGRNRTYHIYDFMNNF